MCERNEINMKLTDYFKFGNISGVLFKLGIELTVYVYIFGFFVYAYSMNHGDFFVNNSYYRAAIEIAPCMFTICFLGSCLVKLLFEDAHER